MSDDCPYSDWINHSLEVYETYDYSLINSSTPGLYLNQSLHGVEGGQILLINNTFYLFITEFTGDPLYVPSNLALWKTTKSKFPFGWKRISTLYKSTGIVDCNNTDTRASLGSSISIIYNTTTNKWLLYYVGFQSCNKTDGYFVNRNGRIFLSESITNNIEGPYKEINVILKPNVSSSQPWEGLQGIDSFSNPFSINNNSNNKTIWMAFYGSALTQIQPCCNQRVGLVKSNNNLYGKWIREPYPNINPISLTKPNNHTEQPIVIKFNDGTYGAVYDALGEEEYGNVGYTWSPNGIDWNPNCGQFLTVNPQNNGLKHWGKARTPQGLIPINQTHFYLFFSGQDKVSQSNEFHESFGYARVRFTNYTKYRK